MGRILNYECDRASQRRGAGPMTPSQAEVVTRGARFVVLVLLVFPLWGQQRADPNFDPPVPNPAYASGAGPRVGFEEIHGQFHSVASNGTFSPFANILRKDGYVVESFRQRASENSLSGLDVLAIVNSDTGYSSEEVAAVKTWVEAGGSLLLVADHMPWPGIMRSLTTAFGLEFSDGFAVIPPERTIFSFTREPPERGLSPGRLEDHPITNGRNLEEQVERVGVFSGSAFQVAGPHEPLMTFGPGMISLLPLDPWDFTPDTPSIPIEGWLQGAVFEAGKGRVAVFGEAAMFSAQLTGNDSLMGINASPSNLQFLLNVFHWLSGLLPVPADPRPIMTSEGVVNAATFASPGVVAPGMFVSLFGAGLASGVGVAEELPLPTVLGGSSATIAGDAALAFARQRGPG